MIASAFLKAVKKNLQFWQERVNQVENHNFSNLHPDRKNIFLAVQIGFTFPDTQLLTLDLALNLYDMVETGGEWQEWLPILEMGRFVNGASISNQIRVLNQLGFFHVLSNTPNEALKYYQEAEKIAIEHHDQYGIANTAYGLSNLYDQLGQHKQAEQYGLQALNLFIEIKAPIEKIIVTHNILGINYLNCGEYTLSQKHLTQAVEFAHTINHPHVLATMKLSLAKNLRARKEYGQAAELFEEALSITEKGDNPSLKFQIINDLGILKFMEELYPEAERYFLSLDEHYLRQNGNWNILGWRYNNLGNVYLKTQRLGEAEEALRHAGKIFRSLQDYINLGNTLADLGETLENQGRIPEASATYKEALQWLEKFPQSPWANGLRKKLNERQERLL